MTKSMGMIEARKRLTSLPEEFAQAPELGAVAVTRRGKRVLAGIGLLAGVFVFFSKPVHAFQVDLGPESVIMQGKYNKPAPFPHRRHQEWHGCTACHHAKDQMMTIDKCEACHNSNMKNAKVDSLRKAGHVLCKNCHSNERAKGRTSAPTQCRGCHIEKAVTD